MSAILSVPALFGFIAGLIVGAILMLLLIMVTPSKATREDLDA